MKIIKIISRIYSVIFILLITSIISAEQFQLQIVTDKDTYYTANKVKVSLALTNTGSDMTVDLYLAYVYPIDLTYFYRYDGKFFWQKYIDSSEFGPGKVAANVFIPKYFLFPLSSLIEFSLPISTGSKVYPIFGPYNLYFAAFESNTGKLVSNIANTSFSFDKLSGKWTNYPYNFSNSCLAMDGDTLWCGSYGGASSIDTKTSETKFYTNANGPISNDIRDITIDLDGNVWFATREDGINVFDGNSWTFLNSITAKIGNEPLSIATDISGKIWVGYYTRIDTFDGFEWKYYNPQDLSTYVNVIAPSSDGKIWFGTQGNGVLIYDGENWVNYKKKNSGIADNDITTIAHDIDGRVWIGTWGYGISVFDGENWTTISVSDGLGSAKITSIAIDSLGRKWIGVAGVGVQVYNNTSWITYTPENSGLYSHGANDILIDSRDRCWFATGKGVSMFDGSEWKNYQTSNNPLKATIVNKIAVDTHENKWISNENPETNEYYLFVFDGSSWNEITPEEIGISTLSKIQDIFVDKGGKVWLGTSKNGISVFDGENWQTYNAAIPGSGFTANYVVSITHAPDGKIWAGTDFEGLFSFDGEIWKKVELSIGQQNLMVNFDNLNFDSSGKLWFSSQGLGLCMYDGVNIVNYNKDNSGFTYEYVDDIAIDSKNRKWIIGRIGDTTKNALIMYDGNDWVIFDNANSPLPVKYFQDIAISTDDKVYIGTGTSNGLFMLDDIDWTVYNSYNSGLLDNYVLSITIDKDGKKWIGTGTGISVLDDSE